MRKFFAICALFATLIFAASCISEDDDKDTVDTDLPEDSQNNGTGDTGSHSGTNDTDTTDTAQENSNNDPADTQSENDDSDTLAESGDNDKTDSEQNDEDQTDSTPESSDTDHTDSTEEPADADTPDPTDDSDNSTDDGALETGLIDLSDWSASSATKTDWNGAYNYCSALTEGSHNWRLPTISELRQLVKNCAGTEYNGACGVRDGHLKESDFTYNECAKCTNRYDGSYSKLGDKDYLWSASELDGDSSKVWVINFKSANIGTLAKATAEYGYARCVRE